MFGNPGTVEQGFLDSLARYPEFKYIMTLQETIAVAMGDGYAAPRSGPPSSSCTAALASATVSA